MHPHPHTHIHTPTHIHRCTHKTHTHTQIHLHARTHSHTKRAYTPKANRTPLPLPACCNNAEMSELRSSAVLPLGLRVLTASLLLRFESLLLPPGKKSVACLHPGVRVCVCECVCVCVCARVYIIFRNALMVERLHPGVRRCCVIRISTT